MKDPYDMSETEFKTFLSENTTRTEILKNAKDIYSFLFSLLKIDYGDSLMREWAFQWYAEEKNDYEVIYNAWLG